MKICLGNPDIAKKHEQFPDVQTGEIPYEIPKKWRWTRLSEIGEINPRNNSDDKLNAGFMPMSLLYAEYGKQHDIEERQWGEIKKGFTHFQNNDVVLAKITPCFENGKSGVIKNLPNSIGAGTTELHVFRTIDGKIYPEYVLAFLKSPLFFKFGIPKMTGTAGQKRVPVEYFATAPFPLAPLAEQKRIVTKIDQLMALCDKLEAERNERNSRQLKVHAAAMAKLFSAPDKQVFNTSWHFITKNFDKLYSVPENVEELKKAILQLAVMGRFSLRNESKVVPLGNIIELISGQHLLANEQNDNGQGIPYLTGPSDFGEKYPVPKRWTETSKAVAEPGDILLTVKGAGVGKTNRLVSEKTAISRQLMAIRVKDADADFVHLILQDAESHFQSTMTGIAIPGIGRRDVLTLKVNLPSPSEQKHIVAITLQLMSLCNALDQQFKNSIAKQAGILDAIISKI